MQVLKPINKNKKVLFCEKPKGKREPPSCLVVFRIENLALGRGRFRSGVSGKAGKWGTPEPREVL